MLNILTYYRGVLARMRTRMSHAPQQTQSSVHIRRMYNCVHKSFMMWCGRGWFLETYHTTTYIEK